MDGASRALRIVRVVLRHTPADGTVGDSAFQPHVQPLGNGDLPGWRREPGIALGDQLTQCSLGGLDVPAAGPAEPALAPGGWVDPVRHSHPE